MSLINGVAARQRGGIRTPPATPFFGRSQDERLKMNEFVENHASKNSIANRRSIYGIGTNDADYVVKPRTDGKRAVCPFYRVWFSMMVRSYSHTYHKRKPTYKKASVCKEWLSFIVFKKWMEKQDWEGKELDKDILVVGNKHYSPATSVFVSKAVNTLLNDSGGARGKYPLGVCFYKDRSKYGARINKYGRHTHLGRYETIAEAESVYRKAKSNHIKEVAHTQSDPYVINGLLDHAARIAGAA